VALAAVAAALTIGARLAIAAASDVEATLSPSSDEEDPWAVATALQRVGVHPGDRVAILGHKDNHEFWARLARVAIVVQLPVNRALRMPPPDLPDTVRAVLAATGAKVIVARPDPSGPVPIRLGPSWQALGETGYYFCPLMD
jgi:long-subunit acyl-CoA synthetase (AMP-forming)